MRPTDLLTIVRNYQSPGMVVAEVGVNHGWTAQHWLPLVSSLGGNGILVDNWYDTVDGGGTIINEEMRNEVIKMAKPYPHTLLEGNSWEVANQVADGSVDVVYIDACHLYSSVRKDILAWAPKVKNGGILAGHDCECLNDFDSRYIEEDYVGGKHHGVIKAVSEMLSNVWLLSEQHNNPSWFTRDLKVRK